MKADNQDIVGIIAFFGTQQRLADKLGCAREQLSRWIKLGRIPVLRAMQIEKLSHGLFKASEMPTVINTKMNDFNKKI